MPLSIHCKIYCQRDKQKSMLTFVTVDYVPKGMTCVRIRDPETLFFLLPLEIVRDILNEQRIARKLSL